MINEDELLEEVNLYLNNKISYLSSELMYNLSILNKDTILKIFIKSGLNFDEELFYFCCCYLDDLDIEFYFLMFNNFYENINALKFVNNLIEDKSVLEEYKNRITKYKINNSLEDIINTKEIKTKKRRM